MNQVIPGIIIKKNEAVGKEKFISYSFSFPPYDKIGSFLVRIKGLMKKTILHDFYNLFTARVE